MTTVYLTAAGDAYHSSPDCRHLAAGQTSGEVQGYELREIVEMDQATAAAAGKTPCGTCGGATP